MSIFVRLLVLAAFLLSPMEGFVSPLNAAEEDAKACMYERTERDGRTLCIRRSSYHQDLCRVIEHYALANSLPPDYFARLIWRESLFRADAVSPKGAEGISQFMPGTARLRGLRNSFDVIEALAASSRYLDELRRRFGNLGLAAAAYNAGENRLTRFRDNGWLPLETRDYVFAITGFPVETWSEKPPEKAAPPLNEKKAFIDACIDLASTRRIREPVLLGAADWAPWGVQLAAHYDPGLASRLFTNAIRRLPAPLNAERALIVRQRLRATFGSRPRYAARIGRESRKEAEALCRDIRKSGLSCLVMKN